MGDTPLGSSARLSGDLERSFERERERLERIYYWAVLTKRLLMVVEHRP